GSDEKRRLRPGQRGGDVMNATLIQTGLAASAAAQNQATNGSGLQQSGSSSQPRKLMKECRQFEGILIASLWNEMEKGMGLANTGSDPGSGTMQGFGIQAAALGIANAGGLGIARMLYHELTPRLEKGRLSSPAAGEGKSE
ncbi:MAG: hypothetical protein P8Z30_20565, partial [Acidobacteriota bacterium]